MTYSTHVFHKNYIVLNFSELFNAEMPEEGEGEAIAPPVFGRSFNPITTRGADYTHHITASLPGFENPAASLILTIFFLTGDFQLFSWMPETVYY